MNPTQPTPDSTTPVNNPIASMRKNETVIFQARRHPIGLIGIHIMAGFLLLTFAVIIFAVLPHLSSSTVNHSRLLGLGATLFFIVTAFVFLFLAIAHKVYWGNSWILTSDSITQVKQTSLFDKQSSQLSLGSLEDISAEQNGILTHVFNYGTVRVETAGERSKFVFIYCPNPNYYAQQILAAREEFEQGKETDEPTNNQNNNS